MYDIGVSSGENSGFSYTEIQLGLNWYATDYLIWRNAAFSKFGSEIDSTGGLDTSVRLAYDMTTEDGELGLGVFAGPGYRISDKQNSGVFGEAGVKVKALGFLLGLGVKSITYNSPGRAPDGTPFDKRDTTTFIILGGGGAF